MIFTEIYVTEKGVYRIQFKLLGTRFLSYLVRIEKLFKDAYQLKKIHNLFLLIREFAVLKVLENMDGASQR